MAPKAVIGGLADRGSLGRDEAAIASSALSSTMGRGSFAPCRVFAGQGVVSQRLR